MTALVTCAHVSVWKLLFSPTNPIFRNIFKDRNNRKAELIESINEILVYRDKFRKIVILECLKKTCPYYLTQFSDCETACSVSNLKTKNKGILEFSNIANIIHEQSILDNEMIFKITGRYILKKPDFLNFVAADKSDYIVRKDSDVWGDKGKGVHTFLFAARAFIIKEFHSWLVDSNRYIEFGTTPIEWIFADYLSQSRHTGFFYNRPLNVLARYSPPLIYMDV